ncbi:protein FAM204A isoform 3-T7 [Podargus strigoides]
MWSGLLPPGLNESDVDLSSDEGNESRGSFSKEDAKEDAETFQLSELQENEPESNPIGDPTVIPVTDGENESQTCPPGVSLRIWNKFVELQKKNHEMKTQANQGNKSRKRKRHRKEKQKKTDEVTMSQQLANEDKWKELTQYFGINDRFESPVDSRAPQKSGLELSIEKSVAEGDVDKAEELSDRLAIRESRTFTELMGIFCPLYILAKFKGIRKASRKINSEYFSFSYKYLKCLRIGFQAKV